MILYIYIAPGQGRNFDVNRNILSLWSFVASFKKISLKSDFIQFFSGDKILMSVETSGHFGHLLQV